MGGEDGKSLSGPETVRARPGGDIGNVLLGVLVKTLNVQFPRGGAALGVDVLLEDRSPLSTSNTVVNSLISTSNVERRKVQISGELDVLFQFLVGLVVLVIKRTSFQTNNTSEPVHVIDSSSSGNLGTETVTSNSSHSDLVIVHESNDVVGNVVHVVGVVVIRVSLVTVVKQPNVSHFSDFVVMSIEESFKVLSRLDQLRQPNHGGQIVLLSSQVFTSELNRSGVSNLSSL